MIIPDTFNPYLDLFYTIGGDGHEADRLVLEQARLGTTSSGFSLDAYDVAMNGTLRRFDWSLLFSWAIPNDEAIRAIVREDPILEVGAGTGYWAWLLRKLDVDVIATDRHEEDQHWNGTIWTEVEQLDAAEASRRYGHGRTLLMVWPPMTSMASEALAAFAGDTLIYVGEGSEGCTGDEDFHATLNRDWTRRDVVAIPQWWGLHDMMYIYDRIQVGKPQGLDPQRLKGT